MAQLVRLIKKRMYSPEPLLGQSRFSHTSTPPGCSYTIDQAAFMESDIRTWLSQLPGCFHFDINGPEETSTDLTLLAQRCEVAITTHRLILKVYLPFLKKYDSYPGSAPMEPPHQAAYGTVNAAHVIVKAAKILQTLWNTPRFNRDVKSPTLFWPPALFDFYPLGRTLFDAAVVCAHAAIKQPTTMWAMTATEDVNIALSILRDESVWSGAGGFGLAACNNVEQQDLLRVVEAAWAKIQSQLSHAISASGPLKRKLDDVDQEQRLQIVAPSDPNPQHLDVGRDAKSMDVTPRPSPHLLAQIQRSSLLHPSNRGDSRLDTSPRGSVREKDKKPGKKSQTAYPSVGIRVRPKKDGSSPLSQFASSSTESRTPVSAENDRAMTPALNSSYPPSSVVSSEAVVEYSQSHSQHPQSENFIRDSSPSGHDDHIYRSRSSSISQSHPAHGHHQEMSHNTLYDSYPPAESSLDPISQHRRYSVDHQLQQGQSGYVMDSPTMYDYSSPYTQRSYDNGAISEPHLESYAPPVSPYGTTSSNGPLSTASSPYTTVSTPAYATSALSSHHASPRTFGQQIPNSATQPYYATSSYDAHYDSPSISDHQSTVVQLSSLDQNMVDDMVTAVPDSIYDKTQSAMYDAKPALNHTLPYQANEHHVETAMPVAAQSWPLPTQPNPEDQYWQHPGEYNKYYR